MNRLRILCCWDDAGVMPDSLNNQKRKCLYSVARLFTPCTFSSIWVCLWGYSQREDSLLLFFTSLRCTCRCTHTCLLPFVSKLYTVDVSIHSWIRRWILVFAELSWVPRSLFHNYWTALLEVLYDPINGWFRCCLSNVCYSNSICISRVISSLVFLTRVTKRVV